MKKFLIGVSALLVLPTLAHAEAVSGFTGLLTLLTTWIQAIMPFLLLLAALFFFWGLTMFILKAGDEEARAEAKQKMIWGVVAVFIMVSFWGLVGFLSSTFDTSANTAKVIAAPKGIGTAFTSGV